MAEGELADITDINSSAAFVALDELVKDGSLTTAQADLYKSKYAKLHEVMLQTLDNESMLLKKARALNEELLAEKKKLDAQDNKELKDEIANLRAEFSKAEAEVALCEERDTLLQLEITELERQLVDVQEEKENKEREMAEALAPRINALTLSIEDLRTDVNRAKQQTARLEEEKTENLQRAEELTKLFESLTEELQQDKATHLSLRNDPSRLRKQADLAELNWKGVNKDADNVQQLLSNVDATLGEQAAKRKVLEEKRADQILTLERHRSAIDQKERIAEEILRNLENEKAEAQAAVEARLKIDIDVRSLQQDHKHGVEDLRRKQKEKENAIVQHRKVDAAFFAAKGSIPNLVFQLEDAKRQYQATVHEKKEQLKSLEELNRDVDIFINSFLQEEAAEKDKAAVLVELMKENKTLEQELSKLSQQSFDLNRQIFELSTRRDAKAREFAKAVKNKKETDEEVKVKEIVILDLSKRNQEQAARLKEYMSLYEVVKNERNNYVNLIQTSQQSAAEMKEKIGILQNEIDILHNESVAKHKAFTKEQKEHQEGVTARDALRAESNKLMVAYREKQEVVDQQIAEIDKLNSVINSIEKEMLRLKKLYEVAVEERNYTGIQLIDRNDELCILYEKSNIQEQILKNGEVELNVRDEEIRVLRIEVGRVEWKVRVVERLKPRIPEYKRSIHALRGALLEERARSEKLSYELESPSNEGRWRALMGKDLDTSKLRSKITHLESRLNVKKEQLLEKELILEEVGALSDRLRRQAEEGREGTLDMAREVNEYQARIRRITRRMMACVSELSMYQATALKFESEKKDKEELLEEAQSRLERGEAPTEAAEREWQRICREQELREVLAARHVEEERMEKAGVVRTTAEPRPNAYIPDELGLPRPYGAHPPMKPSEQGSSMRFIRKPERREIVL